MPSPDKNEPSIITGSRFLGGNDTRHKQREFTCSAVLYGRQIYGLFSKTRPPVSFVMSKFQKQNLVKVPFYFVSQKKKQGVLRWFLMWRWLYGPYETTLLKLLTDIWRSCLIPPVARRKHLSHGIRFFRCILFVHL